MSGSKTYAVGIFVGLYAVIQLMQQQPLDMEVLAAALAGMGITLRHAIATKPTV